MIKRRIFCKSGPSINQRPPFTSDRPFTEHSSTIANWCACGCIWHRTSRASDTEPNVIVHSTTNSLSTSPCDQGSEKIGFLKKVFYVFGSSCFLNVFKTFYVRRPNVKVGRLRVYDQKANGKHIISLKTNLQWANEKNTMWKMTMKMMNFTKHN